MLRNDRGVPWVYRTAECPECQELTVEIGRTDRHGELTGNWLRIDLGIAANEQSLPLTSSDRIHLRL